jgi:hypothetical protein
MSTGGKQEIYPESILKATSHVSQTERPPSIRDIQFPRPWETFSTLLSVMSLTSYSLKSLRKKWNHVVEVNNMIWALDQYQDTEIQSGELGKVQAVFSVSLTLMLSGFASFGMMGQEIQNQETR